MKIFRNHKHLLFFIGSSLFLLAAVEFLWLNKLYKEGKDGIKNQITNSLKENTTRLQITYMQNKGRELVDSFMKQVDNHKKKEEKEIHILTNVKRINGTVDVNDFIEKSQKTYLAKLDTLAKLPLGSIDDKAIIDSFLDKMRHDYGRRLVFVNVKPHNKEDSMKRIYKFLGEQKRAYKSLWYLYRLEYSPQFNRPLMDSFFNALRIFSQQEQQFNFLKWKAERLDKDIVEWTQPSIQNLQILVKSNITIPQNPNSKDSFLSVRTYAFERFISSQINPQDVKHVLDSVYEGTGLVFDIFRLGKERLVPQKGNAIIATTEAGNQVGDKDEKLAVAAYNYMPLVLGNMKIEIGFATFVLVLVSLSFWIIYRNILQQKRLIALKNDFISNMTHELKTPITTVGVAMEAITDFGALNNPEMTKEYLDISKNELNRLSLLVDKVLKMAVFENADTPLNLERFDMNDTVQGVIQSMQLQIQKHNAAISFEKIGENFEIEADKTHITNVIYNLIDNALKYGGEKPDIKIFLKTTTNDNFLKLSVNDNGIGIPPQYKDKVFDKFFRIPTGDVHTVKGHGLGLSYVKNVIEQHKGKIEIESEAGRGSTFFVYLPF